LKKKIRAAVVGVGYLGKFHAEKYAAMDTVELVGVVDIHQARADEIASHVGAKAFYDYRDLFGLVDAVSIAVPTPLHFEIGKVFLEQGVDVLMEKPITVTTEEADILIDIADKKGLILQVGHLERFNPAIRAVKALVNHPVFIESCRMSLYKERGTDVSVVLDLMIHDIDIISHFVHSGIKYCHAMGASVVSDTVDIANAHIEFDNGTVAKVTASRIANKNERKIRMKYNPKSVSRMTRILFPIVVTIIAGLVAPASIALVGFLMFGNLIRECGVLRSLSDTAQKDMVNLITLLLGITIAASMKAELFVSLDTMKIMALGLLAFVFDTIAGASFAKFMNLFLKEKVNPMVGAAGISAFPMSSRVIQKLGLEADPQNHLLMHAVGANVSGQIASVIAGGVIIGLMSGLM